MAITTNTDHRDDFAEVSDGDLWLRKTKLQGDVERAKILVVSTNGPGHEGRLASDQARATAALRHLAEEGAHGHLSRLSGASPGSATWNVLSRLVMTYVVSTPEFVETMTRVLDDIHPADEHAQAVKTLEECVAALAPVEAEADARAATKQAAYMKTALRTRSS